MTRVVAVGCGWVTVHRHIPAIRGTRGLELVGVVDRDPVRAERTARRERVPFAARLDDPALPEFDAVSIGTAPTSHHGLCAEALRAGKHVIVEKPFTMTPAEADELVELARERRRIIAVVHNFQFARSVRRARAILASGRYGALRGVHGTQLSNARRRLPAWYRTLPGGLFYDEAPHFFYLVRSFVGDAPVTRASFPEGPDPADNTPRFAAIEFSSGPDAPFASLYMNFSAALSEWQLLVLLERATLVCDIFRDILVVLPDDGLHRPHQILRTSLAVTAAHWAGVLGSGIRFATGRLDYGNDEVFRRFALAVETGVPPAGIGAEDARAVVRSMHAAFAAAGQPVAASATSSR